MKTALAALALSLCAACASPGPSLSVTLSRPLRQVMVEQGAGTVEASSARVRLFASSGQAVELVQGDELGGARALAQANGSGGR